MNLWNVSMECAGIAEAGGVKNVTYALCYGFKNLGNKVTLFTPVFKCNNWSHIKNLQKNIKKTSVHICNNDEEVYYSTAIFDNPEFNIVFINHKAFGEKEGIYTYTGSEQKLNPENKKGTGHKDALFKDILFQKAVVQYGLTLSSEELPDIVHCQDASTAVIPSFLKEYDLYKNTKCVVTIHNAGPYYHHNFESLKDAQFYTNLNTDLLTNSLNNKKVEPFFLSFNSSAILTTVSEQYANELVNPNNDEQTEGLASIFYKNNCKIIGITNGIDFDLYNPEDKISSHLPFSYNPENLDLNGKYECRKFLLEKMKDLSFAKENKQYGFINDTDENTTFIAYHGRITSQKGITVLYNAIPKILKTNTNIRFIITGQGEIPLETKIKELTETYIGKVVFFNGYDKIVARLTSAVCDFIALPSFFEPCGLEDFIAQIYGTLPVAHKTGGLCKIIDNETGFLYLNNNDDSLFNKLEEVIQLKNNNPDKIKELIQKATLYIHKNFSWSDIIKNKYLPLFEKILEKN